MKKPILTTLFALFVLVLFGQDLVVDTVYIEWDAGAGSFFEVVDQQYDNGAQNYRKTPIGDTATTVNYLFASVVNSNQSVGASAANYVLNKPIIRARNTFYEDSYEQITGTIWNAAIAQYFFGQLQGNYKLYIDGANQGNFELYQVANGTLRIKLISNPTTVYTVRVDSQNTLTIQGLPTYGNTDLYLIGKNASGKDVFMDIDRNVKFVKLN